MLQEFNYRDAAGSHPYFVFTPQRYQVGTSVPLIVMLHGCTQLALDFAAATRMNLLAEQHNFIVVYPQQTKSSNHNLCWNWFLPINQVRGSGEPVSIAGIVQAIKNAAMTWTIDPTRIYVAGISAGAALAVILGVTYPDLFAAIGVHSGLEYQAATSTNTAFKVMRRGGPEPVQQGQIAYNMMSNHARPIPIIVFHGTNDQFVAPLNGDQTVQQWIQTNTLASQGSYTANFSQPDKVTYDQVPGGRAYTTTSWHNADGEGDSGVLENQWYGPCLVWWKLRQYVHRQKRSRCQPGNLYVFYGSSYEKYGNTKKPYSCFAEEITANPYRPYQF